jgi:GTP-binding protein Era
MTDPRTEPTRCGFVRIMGILMQGTAQILLVDTPGIFQPRRRLDRAMVNAAWTGMQDADLTVFMVDAKAGISDLTDGILKRLEGSDRDIWLVLNKVDLVEPQKLLPLIAQINARVTCKETFMVSAVTGEGVAELRDALAASVPEGPHLYPDEDLTDLPDRLLAAEIVREQILLQTHQEVPHETTVETESFKDRRDGSVRIDATITVSRPGHKAILIGAGGARVKEIGARARVELAKLFDRKVHLFLTVKERAGWDEKTQHLRALGLDD